MRPEVDTAYHATQRKRLVAGIREKGITNEQVLEAINKVPRHLFMDAELEKSAYEDKALPIAEGQTISQPYTVAYQTQLLEVQPLDKVLEIGTGSGYQACVLAELKVRLFTIERQRKLFDDNQSFAYLAQYRNIHFFYGDGYEGLPEYAPFDKILVTAAAPEVPEKLLHQLKAGGCMVLPLGAAPVQTMLRLTKLQDGTLKEEHFDRFSFVPMLQGTRE